MKYPSLQASGAAKAALSALCWGSATVMSKGSLTSFSPITLLVLQLAASVLILWGSVWIINPTRLTWRGIIKFSWLGLLEPGLAYLLGLVGLAKTDASAATLIQSTESVMILIVSAIFLKIRPSRRLIGLSLMAITGLFIALGMNGDAEQNKGFYGILLITAGTAAAAIYVVISGKYASTADAIYIVAWQQTFALIFSLMLLPFDGYISPTTNDLPSWSYVWLLAFTSGIVQYAVAFSLYISALKTITANAAGSFLNLVPIFGLTGAFIFLNESMSITQMIGAVIAIASVILINNEDAAMK